jgi:hypothetical protein
MTKPHFTAIALVCLLFQPVLASAQEVMRDAPSQEQQRYELVDTSRQHSPIRIAGYVIFRDNPSKVTRYSYQVGASATNVATKSVVLLCMHFQTSGGSAPGLDNSYRSDYFFGDALPPDGSESVHISPFGFSAPIVNGVPQVETADPSPSRLTATAQVEFVQFSDGSTWGDREAAADALKARRETLGEFKMLQRIHTEQGEQAFMDALSKPTVLPCVEQVKNTCQNKLTGSTCALGAIRQKLEAAAHYDILWKP